MLFIDKQAFDRIHRLKLPSALKDFGVPRKLINLTKLTKPNNYFNFQNS